MARAKKIINKQETCELLNISSPTFLKLVVNGLPFIKRGGTGGKAWSLNKEQVVTWYDDHYRQKNNPTQINFQQRKIQADAILKEIQVAKLRGELISQDAMMTVVAQDYTNVRAKLLSLSSIVAPIIYTSNLNERKEIIDDAIREILDELTADTIDVNDLIENITEELEEG